MDAIVYDAVSKKNFQIQKFTASGTFTAKVTGVHFINGCGAGASGAISTAQSGGAGSGSKMFPIFLTKGQSVTVTIGAGGVWASGSTIAPGGDTSFGSFLTLPGAPSYLGGLNWAGTGTGYSWHADALPIGFLFSGACGAFNGSTLPPGYSTFKRGTSTTNYPGGGGGFYGPGGNATESGVGGSAAANSGAGGGSGSTGGGAGGSGYLEVIYFI